MEKSGDDQYYEGKKLPGVFKQQNRHLEKVKEDKYKLKNVMQNV